MDAGQINQGALQDESLSSSHPSTGSFRDDREDSRDPETWKELHGGRLSEMVHTATLAGDHTLKYFGAFDLVVDAKTDDSPVTIADREAEDLVRRRIGQLFAGDAVAGEEMEDKPGHSGYRWIVDPIDGTKSFICGVPLYSTLLALEFENEIVGGVIMLPALRTTLTAAIGYGCYQKQGTTGWNRTFCRDHRSIDQCVFVHSQADSFAARGAESVYQSIRGRAAITRTWGDGYGYAMVATGRADVMIDPECNLWDVAAVLPVIVESGGRFSNWKGEVTAGGGDGVGCGAGVYEEVLRTLRVD